MAGVRDGEFDGCDFCKSGRVIIRDEVLRFRQATQFGVVHCEVCVPVGRCESCGSAHVDAEADAAIRGAVDRARTELMESASPSACG